MPHPKIITPRTLALYVTRRSVAFVCFIHPSMVIDWGARYIRSTGAEKQADTLCAAKQIIDQFHPNVLVIENAEAGHSRRALRIRRLYRSIAKYAERQKIASNAHSRQDVRDAFAPVGAAVKHELNCAIALLIPALLSLQPRKRRPFDTEIPAQGVFDAAALGLAFFVHTKRLDIATAMQETKVDRDA